ncbi:MAG: hypothetical protein ABI210_12225 [Abditibacteriaceae bacterium]
MASRICALYAGAMATGVLRFPAPDTSNLRGVHAGESIAHIAAAAPPRIEKFMNAVFVDENCVALRLAEIT